MMLSYAMLMGRDLVLLREIFRAAVTLFIENQSLGGANLHLPMSNANTSLPKGKLTSVEGHVIVSYALMI